MLDMNAMRAVAKCNLVRQSVICFEPLVHGPAYLLPVSGRYRTDKFGPKHLKFG